MKRRATMLLTPAVFIVSLFSMGCATILKGSSQEVTIDSNVPGALILLNNKQIGVTPFTGNIPRGFGNVLVVRKPGFRPITMALDTGIEPIFFGNILCGGPTGSTTDYLTGSMFRYAGTIQVDLYPLAPPPQ